MLTRDERMRRGLGQGPGRAEAQAAAKAIPVHPAQGRSHPLKALCPLHRADHWKGLMVMVVSELLAYGLWTGNETTFEPLLRCFIHAPSPHVFEMGGDSASCKAPVPWGVHFLPHKPPQNASSGEQMGQMAKASGPGYCPVQFPPPSPRRWGIVHTRFL